MSHNSSTGIVTTFSTGNMYHGAQRQPPAVRARASSKFDFFLGLESSKSFLAYSWCFRVLSDVDVSDSVVLPRFSELGDGWSSSPPRSIYSIAWRN